MKIKKEAIELYMEPDKEMDGLLFAKGAATLDYRSTFKTKYLS
jgi:hypothetical protein